MLLVRLLWMLTSLGSTWLKAGISNTSSKVSPSPKNLEFAELLREVLEIVAMCKDNSTGKTTKIKFFAAGNKKTCLDEGRF
jgi:hypothetical protein